MKKLLILTQKVDKDDDHFTFFLDWISEFSKNYEKVTVIVLYVGKYSLPNNVEVISLGKEKIESRIIYIWNFFRKIIYLRREYDDVFVHMNPEYIVLGGLLWKLWGKKIGLWYTHRQVNIKLRIANFFADYVFTAVKESYRIHSKKVFVIGHGINIENFKCSDKKSITEGTVVLTTVSRIAPIKNIETMIEALPIIISKTNRVVELRIISKITESDPYYIGLLKLIRNLNIEKNVRFLGAISGENIPKYYCESDFTINLTPTGGLDKTVIESMSASVPFVASNKALLPIMGPYVENLSVDFDNPKMVAEKVASLIENEPSGLRRYLSEKAKEFDHSNLIKRINNIYATGK